MGATENVRHLSQSDNSSTQAIVPRHGVVTLFGYGIQVRVDRGHLVLECGIGPDRRRARLPRVGHGLSRLVVVGSDGMISLAAIRWLSSQKVSFAMLEKTRAPFWRQPAPFAPRMSVSVVPKRWRTYQGPRCGLRAS